MPSVAGKQDFRFDCIVERSRSQPFGGRFGIITALSLALIVAAAAVPARQPTGPTSAGGRAHVPTRADLLDGASPLRPAPSAQR